MLTIFTDGSCSFNKKGEKNKGASAFVAINENGIKVMEKVVVAENTTNNRMELIAVIEALSHYKHYKEEITICTDSEYISNPINLGWLQKWKSRDYKKAKGNQDVMNRDLWEKLEPLLTPNVKFKWVKGHSNNIWNNYADRLCTDSYSPNYSVKSLNY